MNSKNESSEILSQAFLLHFSFAENPSCFKFRILLTFSLILILSDFCKITSVLNNNFKVDTAIVLDCSTLTNTVNATKVVTHKRPENDNSSSFYIYYLFVYSIKRHFSQNRSFVCNLILFSE